MALETPGMANDARYRCAGGVARRLDWCAVIREIYGHSRGAVGCCNRSSSIALDGGKNAYILRESICHDLLDPFRSPNNGPFRHVEEQARFDHTDDASDASLQVDRIGNAVWEGAIQDHVAIVGDEHLV